MLLNNQRELFGLNSDITYLNCAYMGPLLRSSVQIGQEGIAKKLDPSNIQVQDFFKPTEILRIKFSELINCPEPNRVVLIPAASYGIASVAKNLSPKPGSEILILHEQFPSNVYTWSRLSHQIGAKLVSVEPPQNPGSIARQWNERILDGINSQTSVVAIPQVHWTDGTLFDLEAIGKRTREVGAAFIIDGTQSIGAYPFDWQRINADAVICSGYKWLLGPYSIGFAVFNSRFDNGIPIEENWINRKNSEDFAKLVNYQNEYQPGALRYEVGEHSNFPYVPMLIDSISQILDWGVENIQLYCQGVSKEPLANLKDNGYWIEESELRGQHLFGIRLPENEDIDALVNKLKERNIFVSVRGSSIRVSLHLYNSREDLEKLSMVILS